MIGKTMRIDRSTRKNGGGNDMEKSLIVGIAVLITGIMMFGAGVLAAGYLRYTGEETLEEASDNVEEIIAILERVANGKEDVEDDLKDAIERIRELEKDAEDSGKQKDEIKRLEKLVSDLEKEIERANKTTIKHGKDVDKALERAKKISAE